MALTSPPALGRLSAAADSLGLGSYALEVRPHWSELIEKHFSTDNSRSKALLHVAHGHGPYATLRPSLAARAPPPNLWVHERCLGATAPPHARVVLQGGAAGRRRLRG